MGKYLKSSYIFENSTTCFQIRHYLKKIITEIRKYLELRCIIQLILQKPVGYGSSNVERETVHMLTVDKKKKKDKVSVVSIDLSKQEKERKLNPKQTEGRN